MERRILSSGCNSTSLQCEARRIPSARLRRYLVANLLLLLGIGLLWGIVYPTRRPPSDIAQEQIVAARLAEVFSSLPDTVGQWHARELHLGHQAAQALRYDWAAARDYTLGDETIALFVFRARREKAFLLRAHTPYSCALAQGWQSVSVNPKTVTVAGVPVAAQRMVAEKDGVRRMAFYWEFPGWHLDGRGQRVADVYTVQADAVVTASSDETTEMLREFLASLQPGDTQKPVQGQLGFISQSVEEGSAIQLLALDFASRSVRPGSTLEVTSWWRNAQGGYVEAQLIRGNGNVWAEQQWQIPPGSSEHQQRADLAMTVPGEAPIGRYDLRLVLQPSAGGERQPFVNLEGAMTTEVLEPVVVKPQDPLKASELTIQHQLDATLGEEIALLGYDLPSCLEPGRPLSVTLYWQAKQRMDTDYVVFLHLLGQNGQLVTQHDSWPLGNRYPTSVWDAGEIVADTYTLDTTGLPLANYQIGVGMYDLRTMARLPVYVDGRPVTENRVLLPKVGCE